MASSFKSKVIAVTGGASGMGAATCKLLAQRGAAGICIGDWNTKNFTTVEKEIKAINPSTKVLLTKLDVSSSSEVDAWIGEIISKFGRLDGAANVAGVPQVSGGRDPNKPAVLGETNEMWKRIMGVNIDGIFFCTRAEVKAMIELPKTELPRSIVNVASLASLLHTPDAYAYGTSKAANAHFSSSVARDVLPYGIRVNTVSPGATNTPMMPEFFPEGNGATRTAALGMNMMDAADIARAIVYLLSGESNHINGVNLPVGSGAP